MRATTAAQLRTNATWLRVQFAQLDLWWTANPHRWPAERVIAAQRAILDGDEDWCPTEVRS